MSEPLYLIVHKDLPFDVHGPNGGAEIATRALARALARQGKRVVLAAQLKGSEQEVNGVAYWNLGKDYDIAGALRRAGEQGDYFLIATCRAHALLASREDEHCLKRIFVSHDRFASDAGVALTTVGVVADKLVCVSEAHRTELLKQGAPAEKLTVIYNGVDLELFKVAPRHKRNWRSLVFAGALVQDKGAHLLIQAFQQLREKYPDLRLDLYGSADLWGRPGYLDERAIERQVPGVSFHGSVDQEVLAGAYAAAGVCVFPSIWFETLGLSAAEAQATGCPVVAFEVGGVPEVVCHQKTGLVVKEIGVSALAQALDGLLGNRQELERLSSAAHEWTRARFDWQKTAASFIEICEAGRPAERTGAAGRKLGFLTTWNQQCGLSTYAQYLVRELPKGAYVVLAEDSSGDRCGIDESFVERCWKRGCSDYEKLYRVIKQHQIGLIHLNFHAGFFVQPEFTRLIQRLRSEGIKVVAHPHTTFTADEKLRQLVVNSDAVLAHSPEIRLEIIANGAAPERVFVMPHGVVVQTPLSKEDQTKLRQSLQMPLDEQVLCCFGFVQPHKGMEGLVEAVAQLKARGIKARGYIAGGPNKHDPNSQGYLKQLQEYAAALNVNDRVTFVTRFLDDAEVLQYLQAADLVLMNYHSRHFESSGACALALGTGALVATSIAPAFMTFGDAVWHLTDGYQPGLAAELLLTNAELRKTVLVNARRYCERFAWPQIARRLLSFYRTLGFEPANPEPRSAAPVRKTCAPKKLRVLMQNRPNALTQRGGDTVVMENLKRGLEKRGVEVVLDAAGSENPARFDLVHLFNFALPQLLRQQAERVKQAGVPFVVTTLCEDVPNFVNQSCTLAVLLIEYVRRGQDLAWYRANRPDLRQIQPCARFENGWVVDHAAALFTNGQSETNVLRQYYGARGNIVEVKLGYDRVCAGKAEEFIRTYGVRDYVLCVGRLEFRKNQLMLLKALEDSDLTVVLGAGGFSYDQDYTQAVRAFKRKGRTIILDRLSPEMLASAYAAARVHVLPSWYELPGLVSLEAAQHGCRVVATRNGTAPDYFGSEALYCDPGDEASIANAVMAAYYSPLRCEMKEIVMKYTWDRTADETLQAYEKVTGIQIAGAAPEPAPADTVKTIDVSLGSAGYDWATGATDFQETLERGEMAARNREYNLALDLLERALKLDPASVRALRAAGAVHLAENNASAAQSYFEKALAVSASDAKTLSGLGMCALRGNDIEKSYDYFLRSLEGDGEHLVTLLQFIECAYALKRFRELAEVLRRYTDRHPEDANMKYCYAGALYKCGENASALREVQEILQKQPDHSLAAQLRDLLVNDAGLTVETKLEDNLAVGETQQVDRVITVLPAAGPAFDEADRRIAGLEDKKHQKDYAAVVDGCNQLLSSLLTATQEERVKLLKAESTVFQGGIDEAERLFDDVLNRNSESARALCGKGALAAFNSRWDIAQTLFERAEMINPEYDVALAGLGMIATQGKDFAKAWDYYQRALSRNPENIRALLGLIELGYPLGRLADVELAIRGYLDTHPADLDYIYALAGCCFAQNKLDEALAEVNRITLFKPDHEKAQELRGMIEKQVSRKGGELCA